MQIQRWITTATGPARIRAVAEPSADPAIWNATLEVFREARDARLSRFEPAASAQVRVGDYDAPPAPLAPLADAREVPSPYASGQLFHGPAFQRLSSLTMGASGSSARLDAALRDAPLGRVHPLLLDAATHGVPHDAMERWCRDVPPGRAAYPYRIERATFHGPPPTEGEVRCEARFAGFDGHARVALQLEHQGRVWAEIELVEVLLPKGPIGEAAPLARQAFLRDRQAVPGVALARPTGDGDSRLDLRDLAASNWLPGTIEKVYGIPAGHDLALEVAVRDHVGQATDTHPSRITVEGDTAFSAHEPLNRHRFTVERDETGIVVRDAAPPALDLSSVRAFWRERFGVGAWPGEELALLAIERFVRRVRLVDPEAFASIRGRSALFLGNHQVGIESLLFGITVSALHGCTTLTLAKTEHRNTWLGKLIEHLFAYPGVIDPKVIAYFDRSDPASLPRILGELGQMMQGGGKNVTIHVEGTRALSCAQPITKMSGVFVDMALELGAPIVPTRFVGGLPREPLAERLELPFGMGQQDYYLGAPIAPETLRALPYKERVEHVSLRSMRSGRGRLAEAPFASDPGLASATRDWQARTGVSSALAALHEVVASQAGSLSTSLGDVLSPSGISTDSAQGAWLVALAAMLGSR